MKVMRGLVALAGASLIAATGATSGLPGPLIRELCGGEGEGLCLSSPDPANPLHLGIVICENDRTACLGRDHLWIVTVGFSGDHGFDPWKHPDDQRLFRGNRIVRLYIMKPSHARGSHDGYISTGDCMIPGGTDAGAHVLVTKCPPLKTAAKTVMWAWKVPLAATYPTAGAIGLTSVYATNADPASHEPMQMTSVWSLRPEEDKVFLKALGHDTAQQFEQAWFVITPPGVRGGIRA